MERVNGENHGDVVLYAISTCIWCRKTRQLLEDLGIGYSYVYVDLLPEAEQKQVVDEIMKWNPRGSFPTLIIDNEWSINGFSEEKIREAFEK
jgi:glutaredoxin-like protein NrdH